jgi:hypothetical protein
MEHLTHRPHAPPAFEEARNRRQKVRAAGMHPDYWYAVEFDDAVKPGETREVRFWNQSIALFRTGRGDLRAVANRCAHRQLKLSAGCVKGEHLVCAYHGWAYDGTGRCVHIPHDLFGREMPHFQVPTYPVKVRYGLIWVFPGNPELALTRQIPDIPDLEGPDRWACVPMSFTFRAHHSMIIDNVSDFTHAWLHRKYQPFAQDSRLTGLEARGDEVLVSYETRIGGGPVFKYFVDRARVDNNHIRLGYQYPYQWSNTDDKIKHWLFVLPMDARATRCFFLFHFKSLKVPFVPLSIPRQVMTPFLRAANRLLVAPLLAEDGEAVELEQQGYDEHWDQPMAELNPAVAQFQDLTIRKWEEHLATSSTTGASPRRRKGSPRTSPASGAVA